MMVRFQALRVPIARVHTDRAKEFCSQQFRRFLLSKNIQQSTTAGDEPATNGRCEQGLGAVRGMARAALGACGGPASHWPLAIRYAYHVRLFCFLDSVLWQNENVGKTSAWESPNVRVQLYGVHVKICQWGLVDVLLNWKMENLSELQQSLFLGGRLFRLHCKPSKLQQLPLNSDDVLAQPPPGVATLDSDVQEDQVAGEPCEWDEASRGDGQPLFFDPGIERGVRPGS